MGRQLLGFFATLFVIIFSYMIYMPSVTFSLVHAEIFPWAIIYFLLFSRKFYLWSLLLVFVLLMSGFYAFVIIKDYEISEFLRSFFAYLNPLLIFSYFLMGKSEEVERHFIIIRNVFCFLIVLGFLQYLNLIVFLQPLFEIIMPRGGVGLFEGGGRGVSLMSSEPSRASFEVIFLYVAVRYYFIPEEKRPMVDILVGLYVFFVIRAGAGSVIYLVFLFVFYGVKIIPLFALLFFFIVQFFSFYEIRSFILINALIGSSSLQDLFMNLVVLSGHRGISLFAAYKYAFFSPFGGGLGNWSSTSLEALPLSGLNPKDIPFFVSFGDSDWMSIRPISYFSSLALDVGVFGLFIFLYIMVRRILFFWDISYYAKHIIVLFFLYLFFWGSVGEPIPWITVALILRYEAFRSLNKIDV